MAWGHSEPNHKGGMNYLNSNLYRKIGIQTQNDDDSVVIRYKKLKSIRKNERFVFYQNYEK